MLNVYDLENRWLKYKLKKFLPYSIIFFSLIVILIITFFFYQNKEETQQQLNALNKKEYITPNTKQKEKSSVAAKKREEINQTTPNKTEQIIVKAPPVQQKKEIVVIHTSRPTGQEKKEKLKLAPSMNFIRSMRDDTLPYYEHEDIPEQSNTHISTHQAVKQPENTKRTPSFDSNLKNTKPDIKITVKTSKKDIEDVIKRFKKNNNPALSLFIAKKYYELGEYDKSYNYALMTNEINKDIEASWIIFSKSLVKLHKKKMAIKTLKQYIRQSGSDKARRLLNNIEIGKFK